MRLRIVSPPSLKKSDRAVLVGELARRPSGLAEYRIHFRRMRDRLGLHREMPFRVTARLWVSKLVAIKLEHEEANR